MVKVWYFQEIVWLALRELFRQVWVLYIAATVLCVPLESIRQDRVCPASLAVSSVRLASMGLFSDCSVVFYALSASIRQALE